MSPRSPWCRLTAQAAAAPSKATTAALATIGQSQAKLWLPPGGKIWRGYHKGIWRAHMPPYKRIQEPWQPSEWNGLSRLKKILRPKVAADRRYRRKLGGETPQQGRRRSVALVQGEPTTFWSKVVDLSDWYHPNLPSAPVLEVPPLPPSMLAQEMQNRRLLDPDDAQRLCQAYEAALKHAPQPPTQVLLLIKTQPMTGRSR